MNRFITFEGIEGSGKSTQIRLAADYLKKNGIPVKITEEPGGTYLGKKIRDILLNRDSGDICAEAEILLFSAARAQHVKEIIIPALKGGFTILCDRFYDATFAYQGFGRGRDFEIIKKITEFSSPDLKPGLTILFDLSVEVGLKRAMDRMALKEKVEKWSKREDRFEHENYDFHKRVREGYLILAKKEPDRFKIIAGAQDIMSIHREVCKYIAEFLMI